MNAQMDFLMGDAAYAEEWGDKAETLRLNGALRAVRRYRPGRATGEIRGKCPRCRDEFSSEKALTVATNKGPREDTPIAKYDQYECACDEHHPGRPDDHPKGCGIAFALWTEVEVQE